MTLTVYSKDGCPSCDEAKRVLEHFKVPFFVVDLSDYRLRQAFYDHEGFIAKERTVPKVYASDGVLIGGLDELVEYVSTVSDTDPVEPLARLMAASMGYHPDTVVTLDTPYQVSTPAGVAHIIPHDTQSLWRCYVALARVALENRP